jgi:hypothetical protein
MGAAECGGPEALQVGLADGSVRDALARSVGADPMTC